MNLIRTLKHNNSGFIIVAILWILIALATLVTIYAAFVINTAFVVSANDDRIESEELVVAAIELTAHQLTAVPIADRPTSGEIRFHMGSASVTLIFHSENSRIDLNVAPKDLLSNLFVVLGAARIDADDYADRIIAWRSRAQGESVNDKELSLYRAAGMNFGPRKAPFPHPSEVRLVLGIPPSLIDQATSYLTIYSARPQINIVEAAPVVVAALPGMTPERLAALLVERQTALADKKRILELLGPAQVAATVESSKAVRVNVGIRFDNGRQTNSEVVVLIIENGQEPYRVLAWRDAFDQAESNTR